MCTYAAFKNGLFPLHSLVLWSLICGNKSHLAWITNIVNNKMVWCQVQKPPGNFLIAPHTYIKGHYSLLDIKHCGPNCPVTTVFKVPLASKEYNAYDCYNIILGVSWIASSSRFLFMGEGRSKVRGHPAQLSIWLFIWTIYLFFCCTNAPFVFVAFQAWKWSEENIIFN